MKQMNTIKIIGRRYLFLTIACVAVYSLLTLIQGDWYLNARLNLLVGGHWMCSLVSPDDMRDGAPVESPHGFVARYVYERGHLVGYLDRYGNFSPSDLKRVNYETGSQILFVIIILRRLCIALVLLATTCMIWRAIKYRRQLPVPLESSKNEV